MLRNRNSLRESETQTGITHIARFVLIGEIMKLEWFLRRCS